MLHFQFAVLQIQYALPIVSDTKFSVTLPRIKAEKWHKLSRIPKVC